MRNLKCISFRIVFFFLKGEIYVTIKLPFDYRCHRYGACQKSFLVLGQHLSGQVSTVTPTPNGDSRFVNVSEIVDDVSEINLY